MSQHEVEDLVERSIKTLDQHGRDQGAVRELIVNLYRLQSGFDCGYTHGRVHELLCARRALLPRPLRAHPDFERFAALFARLPADFDGWLTPTTGSDGSPGLAASVSSGPKLWTNNATSVSDERGDVEPDFAGGVYVSKGALQIDAGSHLWQRLVKRGDFTGLDAEPPQTFSPQQVCVAVLEAAAAAGNRELMAWWYAMLPAMVIMLGQLEDPSTLLGDADVARCLELIADARAYEVCSDWGLLKPPREDQLSELDEPTLAFVRHWFAQNFRVGSAT